MKPNYRRCISCHKVAIKQAFRRIVKVYPSSEVQLDQGMGRSAYLCPQLSCLEKAQHKNRLGRALKLRTPVPEHIYQQLREDLEKELSP